MKGLTRYASLLAFIAACSAEDTLEPCPTEVGTACTWAGIKGDKGHDGEGAIVRRDRALLHLAVDLTFGPDGRAWIPDFNNHVVRVVDQDGYIRDVIGLSSGLEGDGSPGETDRLPVGDPQGAPADTVALNHPTDVEFLSDGTLVLAAWHNNKVRLMDTETEIVTVLAGDLYGFAGDGGPAYQAAFNQTSSLAIGADDGIYVIDQRNWRIRHITSGDHATAMIDTVAGTGENSYSGDGGPAIDASFGFFDGFTPSGALAIRGDELYVADTINNRIRRIDLADGTIECIAGNGERGYSGDGGPALEASFNQPIDIEFGPDGRLYVADSYNNVIRAIDLDSGTVDWVAGNALQCEQTLGCFEEQAQPALDELQLLIPMGIAFDPSGDLYIADTFNSRIVKARLTGASP